MTHFRHVLPFFGACLLLLAGCGGRSAPTAYYMLDSGVTTPNIENVSAPALQLRKVDIPGYLDRSAIVTRDSGGVRVTLAEFHAWAEPLSGGMQRVLTEVMTPRLLERGVLLQPLDDDSRGPLQIFVEVLRFDGTLGQEATLEVRWTLRNSDDRTVARGAFVEREPVGTTYESLVRAQSRLLVRFGENLAPRLAAGAGAEQRRAVR